MKSAPAFDRPSDAGQRGDGGKVSAAHEEAEGERWIFEVVSERVELKEEADLNRV